MSIESLRGIEFSDVDYSLITINDAIENVSETLCRLYSNSHILKDIYGQDISLDTLGFVVLQFSGHDWTIVQSLDIYGYDGYSSDSRALSRELQTYALSYVLSNVTGYQKYELYDSDVLIEKLEGEQECIIEFQSTLRDSYDDSKWSLNEFINEQGAYIPAFVWPEDNLIPSAQKTCKLFISGYTSETEQLYKFQSSDFFCVDYIALK